MPYFHGGQVFPETSGALISTRFWAISFKSLGWCLFRLYILSVWIIPKVIFFVETAVKDSKYTN